MKILITGTSRGLGYSLAKKYLHEGVEVIGISTTTPPNDLTQQLNYFHFPVNLMDRGELHKALSSLNILPDRVILNAGAAFDDNTDKFSREEFQKNFSLNLDANMDIVSFFLPRFLENKKGTFAAVSSLSVIQEINPVRVGYSASKSALDITFQNLGISYRKSGINFVVFRAGRMEEKGGLLSEGYEDAASRIIKSLENNKNNSYVEEFPLLLASITRLVSILPQPLLNILFSKKI
ncbi:MAG: SDR family NAD(P)-dependent oxidoreductase [Nitrospinae bacterium]|nr:SDR family NAD(P)-dependent oxidoreductase [Nitrospinota bacterium]